MDVGLGCTLDLG